MMASLQASLRAEAARAEGDLAAVIARVNQALYDASSEDRYATFFYGQYDPATKKTHLRQRRPLRANGAPRRRLLQNDRPP